MPEASSSSNPSKSVLDQAKDTVLAMAVDSPTITNVLNRFGIVDLKGADEMFVRLNNTAELNSDIQKLKTDPQFAKVYDELEAKAKAAVNNGELDDLLNAFKGKTLSNGKTLDDKTVKENLAKTIAYVSVNEIKENIPSKWALMGESLGDIWEKSSAGLDGKSFSNQPIEYIVEFIKTVGITGWGFIQEIATQSNAENIAKTKAFNERDKIALHVGGELAARGIMGPISSAVMVEMYDQLGQRSNPPQSPLTQQERDAKAIEFGKKIIVVEREKVREGVGEQRQEPATAAAKTNIKPEETECSVLFTPINYFTGEGGCKSGQGVKGSIYDADVAKYGVGTLATGKIAIATGLAITQKGELLALQEGFAKANPDVIVTFHEGKSGKPFQLTEYKDKDLPESIIIGVSPKKGDPADFYYLRTPGFSMGNAAIGTLDLAKGAVVTGVAVLAAPEAAVVGTVGWVARGAQLAWNGTKIAGAYSAMDATSKVLSGGSVTDVELGAAFKQAPETMAGEFLLVKGGKLAAKALSQVPTEKLGEMLKTVISGENLKNVQNGVIKVLNQSGEEVLINAAAFKEAALTFAKNNKVLLGTATMPALAVAEEKITSPKPQTESTPNGSTVPAPPPTPPVAQNTTAPVVASSH